MALNPELTSLQTGEIWPSPFTGEFFGLQRDGIDIELKDLPHDSRKTWKARGVIFLSGIRIVFIANNQRGELRSFDIPLVYIHGSKFNQPILGCNNLSGNVWPVHDDGGPSGRFPPIQFKLYFAKGGVGTFLRLFGMYMRQLRRVESNTHNPVETSRPAAPVAPPSELIAQAFVDPNDPSTLILTQPVTAHLDPPIYSKDYGKDEKYEPMT
eukprot:g7935.t1